MERNTPVKPIPNISFNSSNRNKTGFELVDLQSLYERATTMDHDPFAPHRINFHGLIYIAEGKGTHFVDFNRHPYRDGSFIFINKNQVHAFDTEHRPKGKFVLFTQRFMDSIQTDIRVPAYASGFHTASSDPITTVNSLLKQSCENILGEIESTSGNNTYDTTIIKLLLMTLLLKLQQENSENPSRTQNSNHSKQLSVFMELIEKHFSSTKSASAYAQMLGVSYKTLNKLCHKTVGKTPKQLIDEHTMLEAKRRLAIEQTQISQLAYELGFEDVGNFVKYFKKHSLITPSQFQNQLKG